MINSISFLPRPFDLGKCTFAFTALAFMNRFEVAAIDSPE